MPLRQNLLQFARLSPPDRVSHVRNLLFPILLGLALTALFWPRLWQGGGFIGGDTYTYFLPQKAFLADRLQAGEFPFWNFLTGHGYPLVGESQTAPLYPLNVVLYRVCDLNTAYVASHLLHYVAAFVAMWLLARGLDLTWGGALLASLVYVYGWFPPRACLEWAIIGGVYLPLALWCLENWFQTARPRWGAGLCLVLALDLLAGHFNLAFITTLAAIAYALIRSCRGTCSGVEAAPQEGTPLSPSSTTGWRVAAKRALFPLVCLGLGYGLAAPQLVPSWDLKRASQRTRANEEFDPGYGHIPPWYLCQVATPWIWYARHADPDQALNSLRGGIGSATNKVEAHLYFGLLPLVLALWALVRPWVTGRPLDFRLKLLAWIGLFGLVYATGWLLPVTRHLPGFSFFRGPGRYGLLTTLAVALLSGSVLGGSGRRRGVTRHSLLVAIVCAITTADLWWVSRHQWYTFTTQQPIIALRGESIVGRRLREEPGLVGPARMLAPGPNLASLTGIATTPPYLGFGPDAYYLPGGRLPDPGLLRYLSGSETPPAIDVEADFAWLRAAGVTHMLAMRRLPRDWPITELWSGADPFLNPAWSRSPYEPLYLYRIDGVPGRAWLEPAGPADRVRVETYMANRVVVAVQAEREATLVLADLPWSEWEVTVDGDPAAPVPTPDVEAQPSAAKSGSVNAAPVQRRVVVPAGEHVIAWTYQPRALWQGCAVAAASLLLLVAQVRRTQARQRGA